MNAPATDWVSSLKEIGDEMVHRHVTDAIGTLATLVSIIDDPAFDATNDDCIRDLLQYINVQVRAVAPKVEPCES